MQSALTKAGVFKDLKTNVKNTTATFTVSADVDFKTKLDEIVAGGNTHVKGYEVEKAAPAKGDGASLQNTGSMQFVSVNNKTSDCCASKQACCKACENGDDESSFVTVSTVVDDKEKKKEKKTKTKTVSLKLPNMT